MRLCLHVVSQGNCVSRQSCAIQLATGIQWARRWVESERNVTDKDSRLADDGYISAGEFLVGSQIAARVGTTHSLADAINSG